MDISSPYRLGRGTLFLLGVIPILYIGFAIVGVVRAYTPVPYWDMWDDYISVFARFRSGDWLYYFFHQSNEHRLPLAHVLFLVDLTVFKGNSRFLFASNVALMVALWVTFALVTRHLLRARGQLWLIVSAGISALALSWLHESNLTWAYQSQFFLAYLVPLAALASLARSMESPASSGWFLAALLLGLCSLGTMANGVAVMPLMVVMMLLAPHYSRLRVASFILCGIVATALWFHGIFSVPRPRPAAIDVVQFVVTFFGAPVRKTASGGTPEIIAGIVFIATSLTIAFKRLRDRARLDPMALALLTFIAYVGATSVVIAWGRAGFNPNAAAIGRYLTPSLTAWCALAVLLAYVSKDTPKQPRRALLIAGAGALLFLPIEMRVFRDRLSATAQENNFAGLALRMGIFDTVAVSKTYPLDRIEQHQYIKDSVQRAKTMKLSVFGDPAWAQAVDALGADVADGFDPCSGAIEDMQPVAGEENTWRAKGWAFDDHRKQVPQFAHIAANGKIVGVAVTGVPRRDIAKRFRSRARYGGFDGYVVGATPDVPLTVVCRRD